MNVDLTGQSVLVTGASRGIGRAIAAGMAEAGAAVGIHYYRRRREAEDLSDQLGRRGHVLQADLSDLSSCERLFAEAVEALGRVDVLVNNAGVALHMPLDQAEADWQADWETTMAVNLRAPELLCRRAIQHFRTEGGGRIVNVASRAAFRGDEPAYMTYAASKAGLVALTRSIARGLGDEGICAFVVAPGFTRTDMARDFIDRYGEAFAEDDIALDRLTEPEDIAPFAVFLASGLADHATGATIDVNAGSYLH